MQIHIISSEKLQASKTQIERTHMMITRQTIPGSWYSLELRRAVSLEISDPTRQGSKAIKIFLPSFFDSILGTEILCINEIVGFLTARVGLGEQL